jgi:hypothetical protein
MSEQTPLREILPATYKLAAELAEHVSFLSSLENKEQLLRTLDDAVREVALAGWLEARESAYLQARGHEEGDGFTKHGTRQLYWKGRSDAATEIRALSLPDEYRKTLVASLRDKELAVIELAAAISHDSDVLDGPQFYAKYGYVDACDAIRAISTT